jgi:hypothetical protein
MKSQLDLVKVFEKIFKIDYPVGEFADCTVENSHYYKAISEHILQNSNLLDTSYGVTSSSIITYSAVKLTASAFAKEEQYFWLEADILESKINDSLDKLSGEELADAYNYFFPIREWKLKAEFKGGEDYFECNYERMKLTTITEMLHIIIMSDLELALLKVKSFLNYRTERRFFYELIGNDSEDIESRIDSILS